MRLRLGRVSYLNCLPLYYPFEKNGFAEAELFSGPPAELNQLFLKHQLDVTPLSSIEYARNYQDLLILPDLSIAADGPVLSVMFFYRQEFSGRLQNIKKVGVTRESATSVVLLKIILKELFGADPQYVPMNLDIEFYRKTDLDGVLLIGDKALAGYYHLPQNLEVLDLGEAFKKLTGLPMVYAVWAVHRETCQKEPHKIKKLTELFFQAKNYSYAHWQEMVEFGSQKYPFTPEEIDGYLKIISHELSEREFSGLLEFYRRASKIGEAPAGVLVKIWREDDWM
ncbi:menaquinone biosynthesis protein [Carboxydothermus ferrireducens]|uniref:Chorismate dehydratase n=1 Tax=Carboxydothermus ferrireducens DSM 11255 TaxID=1119529 RepID=A0ABX2RFC1_9THEO|nr:menaquinone biosynthesis protein [Carboxydothermus ferrireducens]NYE58555.1 chorismate dehydratase [Carboxydothermus ferrireducens DSM 11255]